MNAKPRSRTATHGSPVVLGSKVRGAAGRQPRPGGLPATPDRIDVIAQQVRDAKGLVHALVGRGFDFDHGHHYATDCGLMLWIGDGARLSTWPVDCPACREAA